MAVFEPLYADTEWSGDELSSEQIAAILADFEKFVSYHYIPDKNKRMVRMKLNDVQRDFASRVLKEVFSKKPHPSVFVVLKSRRVGITFVITCLLQYICMRKRNLYVNHLFPNTDTAEAILNTSVKELFTGLHPQLLPLTTYTTTGGGSVTIKNFGGHNINSTINYGSFETTRRGTGNQILVLDEWAFATHPDDVERTFINTVPKTGFSLIIYVSTANGINHFYDLWQQANKSDSKMIPLFYPWHDVAWNTMEPTGHLAELNSLTTDEARLVNIFKECNYPKNTWIGKLAFFDDLVKSSAGDMDKVNSEWPATAEDAFANTGNPVLPVKQLRSMLEKAKAEKSYTFIDMLPNVDDFGRMTGTVSWNVAKTSAVRQYKAPEKSHRYVIGIDPSSGLEDSDYTSMTVVDERTLETVCTFYGRVEDEESAVIATNLGKYYNMATLVPERNMGQGLITCINNIGYPRLYIDPRSTVNNVLYGVRTDVMTKEEALRRLRFFIMKGLWKTKDEQFLDDALHFQYVQLPSGRRQAKAVGYDDNHEPYHDDSVMSNCFICMYLDMRRWREYLIYRNGDPKKGKLIMDNVSSGNFLVK